MLTFWINLFIIKNTIIYLHVDTLMLYLTNNVLLTLHKADITTKIIFF